MKRGIIVILTIALLVAFASASLGFTSIAVSSVKLSSANVKINVGKTYSLKATITPANATNKKLTFLSGNNNIATVDKNGNIKGIKPGKTVISVTSASNKKAVAKCNVIISQVVNKLTTVSFMTWTDANRGFSQAIELFQKNNPYIKVSMQMIDWASAHDKILLTVAAGTPPDSSLAVNVWVPEFVGMKKLENLNPYIERWDGIKDLDETVLKITKQGYDNWYALPSGCNNTYLYCRKDLFAQAGLKLPKTIDEFYNAAAILTKDGVYGFGMRGARNGHLPWIGFTFADGDHKVNIYDNKGNIVIDDPQLVKATEKYVDLFKKGYTPPTAPNDGVNQIVQNFVAGKTAMMCHTLGSKKAITEKWGDNVTVVPMPLGKAGRVAPLDTTDIIIFTDSKNKQEAFDFASFACSAEGYDFLTDTLGEVPYQKSLMNLPKYKNDPYQQVCYSQLPDAFAMPPSPKMGSWTEMTWPSEFQKVLLGKITSEQFVKNLAEALKK